MIKALLKGEGQEDILILGLSDENVRRLKKGNPIGFNLSEVGLSPTKVFIIQGETEQSMKEELERYIK